MSKISTDIKIFKQIIKDESSKMMIISRVMAILSDVNDDIYSKVISKLPYTNKTDGIYSGTSYHFKTNRINKNGMHFEFNFQSDISLKFVFDVPLEIIESSRDEFKECIEFMQLRILNNLIYQKPKIYHAKTGENNA